MATGKRPYTADTGPQLISAILETPPSLPTSHNRRISPVLEGILLKALDKDPEHRYQSAKELRIDLERLRGGAAPPHHKALNWAFAIAGTVLAILILAFALTIGKARDRFFSSRHAAPVA